jgi:glycine betaine/proline transport system substrate-binding protein
MALIGGIALSGSLVLAGESADPIRIVLNNWSSQQVLAHVSGELLKQAGYNVEYHPADAQLQYQAIGSGDLHFQVEVWEGTMKVPFEQQVGRGRVIDAGAHAAVTREEWWYPDHVGEVCPGSPDWQALNDCAEQFATPETAPMGRYLAGPVDWERPDRERVEALELNYDIVNVNDPMTLWAELDAATRNRQPIMLMNWTPNWVEAKYPGKFVEFPAYDAECATDESWGVNPNLTQDCGNPASGWLKKGVWSGLPEKWSCAFELIKGINFDNEQIATAAGYAEVDEMSPEEAAQRWIEENQEVWKEWTPACAGSLQLAAATTAEASTDATTADAPAVAVDELAKSKNCLSCHGVDQKLVGPAFKDVAAKYKGDSAAVDTLSVTVKNGGSGNWGEVPMPPNPTVSDEEIKTLVEWILSMGQS